MKIISFVATLLIAVAGSTAPAHAQKQYGPGVSDLEIKIWQTFAYSGQAGVFSSIVKTDAAYFKMINEKSDITAGRSVSSALVMAIRQQCLSCWKRVMSA